MELIDVLSKYQNIKVVFDIGAHDGSFTKKHKKLLKNAEFFQFEASPNKKPKTKNGSWHSVVLSNQDDLEVKFYFDGGTGDTYYPETKEFMKSKYKTQILKTSRLDTYIEKNNIPFPDVIKIDTQGSELDILRGCDKILDYCRVIHCEVPALGIEFNEGSPTQEEYFEFFAQQGFLYKVKHKDHIRDRKLIIQHDYIFAKEEI